MQKVTDILITALLIFLWVYAALSKLADFDNFRWQLLNQPFPDGAALPLAYLLPAIELVAASLLLWPATTRPGLQLSAVMLATFTVYTASIAAGLWPRIPCACGGIISRLGWSGHVALNMIFLVGTLYRLADKGKPKTFEKSRQK